jgi:hypothetical protein
VNAMSPKTTATRRQEPQNSPTVETTNTARAPCSLTAERLAAVAQQAADDIDTSCSLLVKVLSAMREESANVEFVDGCFVRSWVREINFVVQALWQSSTEAEQKIGYLLPGANGEGRAP